MSSKSVQGFVRRNATPENGPLQPSNRQAAQKLKHKLPKVKSHSDQSRTTASALGRASNYHHEAQFDAHDHETYPERDDFDTIAGSDLERTVTSDMSFPQDYEQDEEYMARSEGHGHYPYQSDIEAQQNYAHQQGLLQQTAHFNSSHHPKTGRFMQLGEPTHPLHPQLEQPTPQDFREKHGQRGTRKRSHSTSVPAITYRKGVFDGTENGSVEIDSEESRTTASGITDNIENSTEHEATFKSRVHGTEPIDPPEQQGLQRRRPIFEEGQKFAPEFTDEELKRMKFAQLKEKTWDTSAEQTPFALPEELKNKPLGDRIDHFAFKNETVWGEQFAFYESLGEKDWDEAGTYLVSKFADLLNEYKQAKQSKRKILEELELEIEKREETIRGKSAKLEREFATMAAGGEGLLKGKN